MTDPQVDLTQRRNDVLDRLCAGDLAGADTQIEDFADSAESVGDPAYRWFVPLWGGALAFVRARGDWGALGRSAAAVGAAAGSGDAIRAAFALRYLALEESGEVGPAVVLFDSEAPAAFRKPRALADVGIAGLMHCIAGRPEQARALLDAFAHPDAVAAADLAVLTGVTEVLWRVGGHAAAQDVYAALLPHEAAWAIERDGAFVHGCVARPLGLLALLLDRRKDALAHFDTALAEHRRAEAPMLVARTLRDWGVGAADKKRLLAAHEAYRQLDVTGMLHQLAILLRAIGAEYLLDAPSDGADPVSGASGLFRREGDEWALSFGGRTARVRDSNGVRDLARMAAEPGRAIPAEDLAADASAAPVSAGGLRAVGDTNAPPDPRAAVAARVKSAIRRITSVHPELGDHLARTVRTGATCSYDP